MYVFSGDSQDLFYLHKYTKGANNTTKISVPFNDVTRFGFFTAATYGTTCPAVECRIHQGFIQRGGRGGFIPLMILARGEYPPHQTAEQCFFNGHFSEVLQESVQKTNPLF